MARLEEFDDVQLDVEFTQAGTRSNITSNENIAISFGKIAKWYEALIPTGGSSGQFLGFNSSGTAKWVSNPNTDQNVKATKLAQSTVEASYYPTLVAGEGTAGVSIIDSAKINHSPGTTSIVGNTRLILGNGINEGTTNNEAGLLRIYSSGTKYHTLKGAKITTDNVDHTLPTIGGTILNTGTTSFTQTLSSGTKIGTIKINGTSSDIYAPNDTDTKVTQTNTTASADYRVLLSGNANDTTETTTGRKSTNLRFNPSSGGLYSFGFLWTDITGQTLDINTLTLSDGTLHSRRFIEKTDGGAFNITNIPVTGHPFLLEVDLIRWGSTTDYITRQRFTNAANGTYSYVRYCTNGTWGSWTTRKYTDTDTKVTSSANHYAPATVSGQDKSASASGATAAWSIDVVKGVTLNTDGKGHVTGLSVTSGKIPANPIPSNNVTGSGTSGYLTKWNGANTITNGPQLGSSTTTFLRNDGTWATPTNTKVTQSATTTTNYRPILFGAKDSTDISTLANTVTDQAYTSTKMFAKPETGYLYASGFSTSSYINGTGAQLAQYGLYLRSYKSASLPAGGDYSYAEYAIRVYDGKSIDNNGMLLTIDGGGLTIVGGGESAKSLAALISDDQRDSNTSRTRLDVGGTLNTAYHGSEEQLILSSDNNIYFLTTCQTIANRKPVVLDVNSYFYPGTTKTGSIGTSSYMWNSVYAATIYENSTSLASKYAAIGHSHGLIHSNLNQMAANGTTGGWSVIGIDPAVAAFVLKSIRINQTSPNWLCGDYGAGIAFGGADTKGVISMKYGSPVITFAGGNHSSSKTEPVWYLKISGTSGSTYNLANFYDSTISRTANTVLAAPNGSDGTASFRKLVAADIPTLNYIGAKSDGSYYGMTNPAGADNVWIRTTSLGIIPYQSGNAGSGHGSLGTSSWYFSSAYIDNIYGSLNGNATTATKATQDGDGNTISSTYLKLSGGIMTGTLTAKASQYADEYSGALNMNNSNIYGVNAIYTTDVADNASEGIHFYRDSTHVDTLWMNGGSLLFVPNRELGVFTTAANSQKVARFTANPTTGQVVITDGTTGGIKSSGYTIATSVPSGAVFTDQKVRQSATTTEDFRPILMGATHVSGSSTGLDATVTDEAYVSTKLYCQPMTGNLYVAGDIKRAENTLSLWSGNDCAGVSQRNNYDINTWYGFSVSNACTAAGTLNKVAFSVNARNGQAWHTGNVHLYSASGDSPALVFQRGTFVDDLNDWKIYVSGGELRFAQSTANASSETWTTKMYFHASNGNLYVGSTKVSLEGHTHNYAGSSSAGGAATSANILNKNNTAGATTTGVQYANGQLTVGTADGNAVEGSNASYKLWSYPAGGTAVGGGTANIQNLRLYWSSTWFRDIFISPNNYDIYHRSVAAGTAQPWRKILDSGNYTSYALPRNIKHIHTASGTEGSTGWVKIARITVTNLYANHPMTFTIAQRGLMQYRIHLVLVNNSSVAAAAISEFIIARDNSWTDTNNNPRAYIIKPSDGIFDLYIRKTEAYDHIFVVDFTKADGSEGDNYSVTWTNVHAADSEITGGTEAVKKLYLSTSGGTMTGELKQTTQLRIYSGNYGTIFRNDGTNTFFLLTESGSAESGSWNSLRPLYFSNSTGKVTIGNGLTVYNGITGDLTGNVTGNCSGSSGSCTGNSATSTRANYLDVVAGNEVRFYNNNQVKEARHFWLGYSWADGSHYTPSGGSDTSSTTAPNITKFVMGNCSGGGLTSVHAKTFILGNGSSPTLSSKTTTITTAATTTDRTITLPDDSGTVALTSKTFNVTRGFSVSTATTGYWAAMCNSTQAGSPTLPTAGKWWHVISMDWTNNDINNWISQLAIATQDGSGVWWRQNNASGTSINSSTWHRLAEGDSSGNAVQATKLRSSAARTDSSVGTADTTPYQKYWVKIASCYTTENYTDLESLWAVNDVYGNRQGILKVRARVEGTAGTFGNTRTIRWLVADNSIDVNMFAIVCYNNRKPDGTEATGTATVELWWKSTGQYASFSFVLLDETRRAGKQPNDWTLYDTSTYGQAALPTTGNITYSVAATILNSTTGNAATATKATQDADGNTISSTYLKLSGGTMTGQLKTSFKESVAVGSYLAQAAKIPDLCTELRYSSGAMGSVSLTEAYTKDGITIYASWYNFIWIPHRSGGVNGAASGDNCNYGSLILSGMTGSGAFIIRYASGSIAELKYLYKDTTYSANNGVGLSGTTFYNSGVRSTTLNGNYLRVNTNGTNADLTIPYATKSSSVSSSGTRSSWWNDRDNSVVQITTGDIGYRPLWSLLTATSGSWAMGNHTDDDLVFNFTSKAVYDTGTNPSTNVQIHFTNGGAITASGLTLTNSGYGPLKIVRSDQYYAGIKFYNNTSTYLGSIAINAANNRFVRFKTDESTSYTIIDTSLLNVTESTNLGLDGGTSAFGYVSGLTKAAWNFQQTDGTIIRQLHNTSWKTEIFMDYRTGQMSTRGKNNGTWQDWRIHLDSGNFSSYAVPIKTGGGIAECSGNGEYLYYTIATITISGAYVNKPILFEISGRGHHFTRLEVEFASSSGTDPGLDTNGFVADGYHGFWIKKTATSTWVVYGKYTEKNGKAVLHRITGCGTSEVTVTVNMTNYGNSLPDGCTQVTYGWMALLADRALRADKASKLSTSSAIGSDTQPVYFDSDGYPTACYPMSRTSTIYDNSSGTSTIISDLTIPADTKYFKIFIFDFNTSGSHYVTNVIDIGVDDGYYGGVISGSSQSQSFPCVITVVQLIVATTSNNRKQISIGRSNSWTIGASPSSSTHTLYIRKIIACT